MIFWLLVMVMIVIAVLCVLVPLSRHGGVFDAGGSRSGIYQQQLREFDMGSAAKSDDTRALDRAEIGRRLLAAHESEGTPLAGTNSSRVALITVSVGAMLFIPGFIISIYGTHGAPGFDTSPIVSSSTPVEQQSVEQLIFAAEKQLESNPGDLRGWTVVAAVYGRQALYSKRANALSNIIRLSGPTAPLLAELGEAQSLANDGIVSEQAMSVLGESLKMDPNNIKARAYLLFAKEQEGNLVQALRGWQYLLGDAGGESIWEDRIRNRIAGLQNRIAIQSSQSPDTKQVNKIKEFSQPEQQAMVKNMVARLARRLDDDSDDIDGWLRLLRSYHVLGNREALGSAWQKSTMIFSGKPEDAARLKAAVRELGYSVSEAGELVGGVEQ